MRDDGHRLITCILSKGLAIPMVRRLRDEKGIRACNVHNARGIGRFTPSRRRRLGDVTEQEILEVVTPAGRADEIFEFLYFESGINRPDGGLIFMTRLVGACRFDLPDLPVEA